jgi:translation elongation factor EF-1alpha
MRHESLTETLLGNNVSFNTKTVSVKEIKRGMVTCDNTNDPPKKAKHLRAQVIITNHPGVIYSADIVLFCIVTLLILRESSQNQKKRSFIELVKRREQTPNV